MSDLPANPPAAPVESPLIVCIVGMHRSGTSVLTAILERLGVFVSSPHRRLPSLPDNPLGYWEHRGIKELNEELLHRLGGQWHTLPPFPAHWQTAPALADLRERAQGIVRTDFAGRTYWGWKDPRACVLLPFWQALLPPMRYIVCVRHPVDVALSLAARDDVPFDHALRLWLVHYAGALAHTNAAPRTLVHYEALLQQPEAVAAQLGAFLGYGDSPIPTVSDLVVGSLRHHAASSTAGPVDDRVPPPIRSLYEAMCHMHVPIAPEAWAQLAAASATAVRDQVAFDQEQGLHRWISSVAGDDADSLTPLGADLAQVGLPRPVSSARVHARAYLADHPRLGGLYRRLRRAVRRALRLGP